MSRIDKTYFTLDELEERWAVERRDLAYLSENGILRLSVRVFGTPIERGEYETFADGSWHSIPYERARHSGLLDLHERDACHLFRKGRVRVDSFHAASSDTYIRLIASTEALEVLIGEVVVRRKERDRIEERELLLAHPDGANSVPVVSEDFRDVQLGLLQFHFGPLQAEVIRRLHIARSTGERWCHGKALLTAAGSRSLRMADVFKSQGQWRRLILSDGHGHYRLADR